jgi:hypothetical protein
MVALLECKPRTMARTTFSTASYDIDGGAREERYIAFD